MLQADNLTDEQRAALRGILDQQKVIEKNARQAISASSTVVSAASKQLNKAKAQLNAARAQLAAARAQLNNAKAKLAAAKATAQRNSRQQKRASTRRRPPTSSVRPSWTPRRRRGRRTWPTVQAQIAAAQDEIDRLSAPIWYVLDRSKLDSYAEYAATADRMDAIAAALPRLLLRRRCPGLPHHHDPDDRRAAHVDRRVQGPWATASAAIAFKYVTYAAIASLVGGAIGVAAGINVFPKVIFDSWAMMYELPPMEQVGAAAPAPRNGRGRSVLLTSATAYLSVRKELAAVPATLMRPKAPTAGKVILLERLPALWSRLSLQPEGDDAQPLPLQEAVLHDGHRCGRLLLRSCLPASA